MKADLFDLLAAKKRLWRQFYQLTVAQAELLVPDKADELLQLLDRKEECIKALDAVQDELNAAYKTGGPGIAEQEEIKKRRQEIFKLIDECRQVDNINRQKISVGFNKFKQELNNFQAGKEAVSGYVKGLNGNKGAFVDTNR